MKHFVTAFLLFSSFLLCTSGASAQVCVSRAAGLSAGEQAIQVPFIRSSSSPTFETGHGKQKNSPQFAHEGLFYFMDTTGGNILNPPPFGNDTVLPVLPDTNTFYTHGYAEHFSTTLAHPYLDSVQCLIFVDTVPSASHITFWATRCDDQPTNGGTLLPFVDIQTTADLYKMVNVQGTKLHSGTLTNLTVKIPVDLTKTNAGNDFAIFLDRTGNMGPTANIEQNQIQYLFDANPQPLRQIDTTLDRSLFIRFTAAENRYSQGYMAGRYIQVTMAGDTNYIYPNLIMTAFLHDPKSGVSESSAQPAEYRLAQNYPNPFNPSTQLRYALPVQSQVTLKVTNALGQEVATLVNSTQRPGEHSVHFDASNLPSGTYFYTLKAGSFTESRRMVLSK